jgi:hypothetical protein
MKKEATNIIRHPHYPEIIKFKIGSVKTISTLSNSNWDEDMANFERLSVNGDCIQSLGENISVNGDNERGST